MSQCARAAFQYRDAKTDKMGARTLPGADFLWLVLQHVLPQGPAALAQLRLPASEQHWGHSAAAGAALAGRTAGRCGGITVTPAVAVRLRPADARVAPTNTDTAIGRRTCYRMSA